MFHLLENGILYSFAVINCSIKKTSTSTHCYLSKTWNNGRR